MKHIPFIRISLNHVLILLSLALLLPLDNLSAQEKKGGNRDDGQRPAAAQSRPAASGKNRPAVNNNNRPSSVGNNNNRPSTGNRQPAINNSGNRNNNINNSGNRNNINGNRNINSGNKNVNINNSHNTVVRRNPYHPYTRPPYVYGGRRYYSYHPYYYHPYRPFYWGPVWHPWGFFVAALATTAIIISIENQQYHYDQGIYYMKTSGGYTVVPAPVGATITTLPPQTQTVVVNETTNNYYYGGTYYEKSGDGYTVVPPTAGTIVENLPEGGKEVTVGGQKYVKVGETYYQPIQKDGKNMYEVAEVEDDDN
jgi:hypothetical protein